MSTTPGKNLVITMAKKRGYTLKQFDPDIVAFDSEGTELFRVYWAKQRLHVDTSRLDADIEAGENFAIALGLGAENKPEGMPVVVLVKKEKVGEKEATVFIRDE